MNKTDLINQIAFKSELTKCDSKKALDAIIDSIIEALKNKDSVKLIGFGSFEITERAERRGVNPQTGQSIIIPSRVAVRFKSSKSLSEKLS